MAKPFLKWAGGKRKLVPFLLELAPKNIRTYYEPFFGGGALFWALEEKKRFRNALINDFNSDLINTYNQVKFEFRNLLVKLRELNSQVNKETYETVFYQERAKNPKDLDAASQAARFIILNKLCFNGLYRVNKKGQFNVPFGKYKNVDFIQEELLKSCSIALEKAIILNCDFETSVEASTDGDFVMFDPPYLPLNTTSNFVNYTTDGFGINDHKRLAHTVTKLTERGVKVIVCNSDTPLTKEIFSNFKFNEVKMARAINSNPEKRGKVSELVITNF